MLRIHLVTVMKTFTNSIKFYLNPVFPFLNGLQKKVSENGKQPVFTLGLVPELMKVFQGIIKSFLDQIFGKIPVTGQSIGAPQHNRGMRINKSIKIILFLRFMEIFFKPQ